MNVLGIIAAITLFATILLGGHFFIYFSVISFFNIQSLVVKLYLAGSLIVLGVSFFPFSALAHYNESLFAKVAYFISSLWLGVGWNVTMAFFILWIIIFILRFFNVNIDGQYWAILLLILTLVYSSWGIWIAYNPKIKNITVSIKNLPLAWKDKKIVQLSDVHLGHIYGKRFFSQVVTQVNAQNPDMIFITGDLFDGIDGKLDYFVSPLADI